jgi:hypothetical protein
MPGLARALAAINQNSFAGAADRQLSTRQQFVPKTQLFLWAYSLHKETRGGII